LNVRRSQLLVVIREESVRVSNTTVMRPMRLSLF
jgi:hypothetical protein